LDEDVLLRDARYKERYKSCYDRRHNAHPLAELKPGDSVRIKTDKEKLWRTQGTVQEADPKSRSYIVETPRGSYRRNRRYLQKTVRRTFATNCSKPDVSAETFIPDRITDPPVVTNESPLREPEPETVTDIPATPQTPKPGVVQTRYGRAVQRPKKLDDFVE
jgi:hypothetical protein